MSYFLKPAIFILFLLGLSVAGYGQKEGQVLIDSLEAELKNNTLPDKAQVDIRTSLCLKYRNILPAKGIECGLRAEKLAEKISYNEKLGEIYLGICYCYNYYDDITKSYEYSQKAVIYNTKYENDAVLLSEILSYAFNPNNSDAEVIKKLDVLSSKLNTCNDINWQIETIGALGNAYVERGSYKKGKILLDSALHMAQKANKQFLIFHNLTRIAHFYHSTKNYDSAIKLFNYTNPYFLSIGEQRLRCESENALALCLNECYKRDHDPKKLDDAMIHIMISYDIAEKIGYTFQEIHIYATISYIFSLQRKYDSAYFYQKKGMELTERFYGRNARSHLQRINKRQADEIANMKIQKKNNLLIYFSIGIILCLFFIVWVATERKKYKKLLLNILPTEIARKLIKKQKVEPTHYENVTVLFTDFVNFTSYCEKMSPKELIDELDTCFKAFDEIATIFHVERIKTIGDAYFAVSGLPLSDPLHAEQAVQCAKAMRDFMFNRHKDIGGKTFEIRIGIHSGNVVAGIVGVKKYAYDIWGDTVNTAARMEQNSEPGKINISEITYELIKDRFPCIYRGEIEAKNKGSLKMYYVS